MSELYVEYAVMDGAAEDHRRAADILTDVEQVRAGATIPAGSLGTLVDAEAIQSAFTEATNDTAETLEATIKACQAMADMVDMLQKYFRAVDEAVAESFDAMAGGAR
jgi:hypothetical protein